MILVNNKMQTKKKDINEKVCISVAYGFVIVYRGKDNNYI